MLHQMESFYTWLPTLFYDWKISHDSLITDLSEIHNKTQLYHQLETGYSNTERY